MRLTRARLTLMVAICGAALAIPAVSGSSASRLYRQGRKAERSGAIAEAYLYYSQAAASNPRKAIYRNSADALASMAAMQSQVRPPESVPSDTPGSTADAQPAEADSSTVFDPITGRELAQVHDLLPAAHLELKPGPLDFSLDADSRKLFEQVAVELGLQVVFDGDFRPGNRIRFHLDQAEPREVLHALEAVTRSIVIPLAPKLFMVAADSDVKRKDLEQVETASVPIPSTLTVQEITELGQAVKQSVGVDKVYWDAQAGQIVLRDGVTRVLAAQAVLRDLTSYRSQVALDLQFIELDETQMQDIGVDLQTSFPITYLGNLLSGTSNSGSGVPLTLSQISKLGVRQLFGVSFANVDVIAKMNAAGARTLLKTTVVSVEGQKASFHVGDKYPILTSAYVGSTSSQVYRPTPSFTFEDLGILINMTPHVHGMGEVSLDLDSEFKVLGAGQQNGIPIISNRKLQSTFRLKNDQWALVAGLNTITKARTFSGPPLLSRIPFLGNLISRFTRNESKTYVMLAIKPRLLSLPPDQRVTRQVFIGSDSKAVTPL